MRNLDQAIGIHAQTAILRAKRAEILAANLANADTPHYKARDLDFSALLSDELGGTALNRTNGQHLAAGEQDIGGAELLYRVPAQASLDQNTVDVQAERAAFLDNAVRYQASLRFLESKLTGLLNAFRGD
ncbi:MAG: flagellar basal body rod protein FlgB [Gammaproteobacteria bacterium]